MRYFAIILNIIVIMCLTMLISLLNKQLSRLGLFIQSSFSSVTLSCQPCLALGPSSPLCIPKRKLGNRIKLEDTLLAGFDRLFNLEVHHYREQSVSRF